eukprot:961984-Prymnesium_polylepis.1
MGAIWLVPCCPRVCKRLKPFFGRARDRVGAWRSSAKPPNPHPYNGTCAVGGAVGGASCSVGFCAWRPALIQNKKVKIFCKPTCLAPLSLNSSSSEQYTHGRTSSSSLSSSCPKGR